MQYYLETHKTYLKTCKTKIPTQKNILTLPGTIWAFVKYSVMAAWFWNVSGKISYGFRNN